MQEVVIVAATRTAIGAFQGSLANISAHELSSLVIRLIGEGFAGFLVRNSCSILDVSGILHDGANPLRSRLSASSCDGCQIILSEMPTLPKLAGSRRNFL